MSIEGHNKKGMTNECPLCICAIHLHLSNSLSFTIGISVIPWQYMCFGGHSVLNTMFLLIDAFVSCSVLLLVAGCFGTSKTIVGYSC